MAMITCPECRKKISETADNCPNCGYQLTPEEIAEIKKKEQKLQKGCGIGCLSVVVIFVILYIIGSFLPDNATTTGPKTIPHESTSTKEQKTFAFTPQELIDRYNDAFMTMDQDTIASEKNDVAENDKVMQIDFNNKNLATVVNITPKNKKVSGLIFLGSGDGTVQSGADIIIAAAATAMAIEDPFMEKEERGLFLNQIGLSNGQLTKINGIKFNRNGVHYNASFSDTTGFMLAAEPIE